MTKKNNEEHPSLTERLCRSLDISPDVLPNGSYIGIRGRNMLNVSGCGRILVYTPEEIRLCLSHDILRVSGRRLRCVWYHSGEVGIDGLICSISFEKKEDEKY